MSLPKTRNRTYIDGVTQVPAGDMNDLQDGIVAGSVLNGGGPPTTGANTPQAQFKDSAGNSRSVIDHIGYRSSRVSEFREAWLYNSTFSSNTTFPTTYGPWQFSASANALSNYGYLLPSIPSNAVNLHLAAAGVVGNFSRIYVINPFILLQAASSVVMEWDMALSVVGANKMTVRAGMAATPGSSGTTLDNCAGFVKRSTDTNWQAVSCDASTMTFTDTGVAPVSNTAQRFRMEVHGASSPYGAKCRYFINEVLVAEIAATQPAAGNYSLTATADVTTNLAAVFDMYAGAIGATWNRYLSTPIL